MPNDIIITPGSRNISFQDASNPIVNLQVTSSALYVNSGKGIIYATARYL
jgi:hypothetical protein